MIKFRHKKEIEEICWSAAREQELEVKMRMTEDEWTEQVFNRADSWRHLWPNVFLWGMCNACAFSCLKY